MKRIIALVLSLALLLTGCGITPTTKPQESETPNSSETSGTISDDVVLIDPIENMELSYFASLSIGCREPRKAAAILP